MSEQTPHHENQTPHSSDVDYERTDAKPLLLGVALVVGMVLLGLSFVGIDSFFTLEKEKMIFEAAMKPESTVLRDVRSREDAIMTSYGVVDSTKGTYRIPIDQAMKKMAEEAYAKEKLESVAR